MLSKIICKLTDSINGFKSHASNSLKAYLRQLGINMSIIFHPKWIYGLSIAWPQKEYSLTSPTILPPLNLETLTHSTIAPAPKDQNGFIAGNSFWGSLILASFLAYAKSFQSKTIYKGIVDNRFISEMCHFSSKGLNFLNAALKEYMCFWRHEHEMTVPVRTDYPHKHMF